MKKLLMTMAASVAAIGLTYADGETNEGAEGEATVQPTLVEFTNAFNSGDDEQQTLGEQFNPDAAYGDGAGAVIWKTDDKEGIVVTNATEAPVDFHLKLETAKNAPLLRTFADYGTAPEGEEAVDNRAVTPIENQDVIVDAMISFTGFEEEPTPTEGEDKILVWMKAVDIELDDNGEVVEGTGITNLMITAGQITDGEANSCDSLSTVILENAEVNKEYRVTIKSVGNIGTTALPGGRLGFEVYIDGNLVSVPAPYWESCGDDYINSGINKTKVFPALIAGTSLKAAGFEGTGTIDDVLVCAADNTVMAPGFTQGGGEDEIDPIAPGGESEELASETAATELAETINTAADKSQYIIVPAGITASKDAYLGMFEAVASGKKVLIQLTEDAVDALQEEVDNLSTNATTSVAALLSTLASAGVDADDPVLNITGGKPGFWYSIMSGAELNGMEEGDRVMAADNGAVTLTVPVIKVGGEKSNKAFYKVLINLNDKAQAVE